MHHALRRRQWILATLGSATLAGCGTIADTVGTLTGSSAPSRPPAPSREVGVPATASQTATIRAAYAGDAQARAELEKMGYRSPQRVLQAINHLVQGRQDQSIKPANFRAENRHGNALDGASLTLYSGSNTNPRWWVDVKVSADAGLNTVVEGVYKLANTPRGPSGEGHDLMRDLRLFLGVSTFDDRLPPALLIRGHFAGF
jgi:hypothetical protein